VRLGASSRDASSAEVCEQLVERLLFIEGLDWYEVRRTVEAAMIRVAMRRTERHPKEAALLLAIKLSYLEQLLRHTHREEAEEGAQCRLRLKEPAPAGSRSAGVVSLSAWREQSP
jgi:hypothetical protein